MAQGQAGKWSFEFDSAQKTQELGFILGSCLEAGAVVALEGELGAGKTELVKGIARALEIPADEISSPTFTLINEYDGQLPLYHFDFYRLSDPAQLDQIGADEYLWGDGICAVEWADLFPSTLPEEKITIKIKVLSDNLRSVTVLIHPESPLNLEKFENKLQKL